MTTAVVELQKHLKQASEGRRSEVKIPFGQGNLGMEFLDVFLGNWLKHGFVVIWLFKRITRIIVFNYFLAGLLHKITNTFFAGTLLKLNMHRYVGYVGWNDELV